MTDSRAYGIEIKACGRRRVCKTDKWGECYTNIHASTYYYYSYAVGLLFTPLPILHNLTGLSGLDCQHSRKLIYILQMTKIL